MNGVLNHELGLPPSQSLGKNTAGHHGRARIGDSGGHSLDGQAADKGYLQGMRSPMQPETFTDHRGYGLSEREAGLPAKVRLLLSA